MDSVREIVTESARAKLPWLTLYALSTENYRRRPRAEIMTLMALLRRFMIKERPTFMENDVRLRTVGRIDELPAPVVKEIRRTVELTANNKGTVLSLALNYGGRGELLDATKRLVEDVRSGSVDPATLTEADVAARLDDPTMPDVDLLIRTAGEMRISNFLLWQVSYAEIHITQTPWPDFKARHLGEALDVYRRRDRRFGGLLTRETGR